MKRKTLAILLAILLVVSAVTILVACSKEYTITFRNYNSAPMDKLTTVKGKVTYTKNNLTMDDRVFAGWYDAATGGNQINLETTVFKKDTTLYAHWTLIGESVGYCIPGVINGESNWDLITVVTDTDRKLAHQDGTNVYTMTDLVLKQGDSFKVVSAVPAATGEWAGNVKIEAGYSQMDVEIAQDATLPDDVDGSDTEVLIGAGDMNNISIKRNMTIDLRFEYGETSEDCVVKITIKEASGAALAPIEEVGYIIAGSVSSWNGPFAADGKYADYILTPDAEKVVYTGTNVRIASGGMFKIKVNESIWDRGQAGFDQITSVTKSETAVLPEGVELDKIFVRESTTSDNIKMDVPKCTAIINIAYDTETNNITIEVVELEEQTVTHDMYLIGTFGGGSFDQAYETAIKLTKGEDSTVWAAKITITEEDYGPDWTTAQGGFGTVCAAIKVKNNINNADYGIGADGKGNVFLLAGDYYITYDETDNSVKYEPCAYYLVGTFVDGEDNNVSFTVQDGITPKMIVSEDGLTATATVTVTDVSDRNGYTWLGTDAFAVQAVYGTSLGVAQWLGSGNTKIAAAGTYTVTLTIATGALEIVAAE